MQCMKQQGVQSREGLSAITKGYHKRASWCCRLACLSCGEPIEYHGQRCLKSQGCPFPSVSAWLSCLADYSPSLLEAFPVWESARAPQLGRGAGAAALPVQTRHLWRVRLVVGRRNLRSVAAQEDLQRGPGRPPLPVPPVLHCRVPAGAAQPPRQEGAGLRQQGPRRLLAQALEHGFGGDVGRLPRGWLRALAVQEVLGQAVVGAGDQHSACRGQPGSHRQQCCGLLLTATADRSRCCGVRQCARRLQWQLERSESGVLQTENERGGRTSTRGKVCNWLCCYIKQSSCSTGEQMLGQAAGTTRQAPRHLHRLTWPSQHRHVTK